MVKINDVNKFPIYFFIKWILVFGYLFLCVTNILNFELWPQVTRIWNLENGFIQDDSINSISDSILDESSRYENAHILRYYLTLPLFYVSVITNVSYNYLFTLIFPLLVFLSANYINKSVLNIVGFNERQQGLNFIFIFLLLSTITFFMNGRMIFAVLGASVLLFLSIRINRFSFIRLILLFFVGIFLTSVSSGAFVVYYLSFSSILFFYFIESEDDYRFILVLVFVFISLVLNSFLFEAVMKNVDFYGGGISGFFNMLNHGLGKILFYSDLGFIWLMSIFCALAVFLLALLVFFQYHKLQPLIILFLVSLAGGLFGYSTLVMSIPPIIALISFCIFHFFPKGKVFL